MKVFFTSVNVSYACAELGQALLDAVPAITLLAKEYEKKKDPRTLIIVLTCPCCKFDPRLRIKNAIFVTPFKGISSSGCNIIQCVDKYPPYREPGRHDEAQNIEEYLAAFRTTIDKALIKKKE